MSKTLQLNNIQQPKKKVTNLLNNDIRYNKQLVNDSNIKIGFNKLPSEIVITTMTFCCNTGVKFNCENIARYVDLMYCGIVSVKFGKDTDTLTNRSLIPKKKKNKTTKKKKKQEFYNQVSLYVMIEGKKKKPISVKLFKNGAIQMTGCKTFENAVDALVKIFYELSKIKAIIVTKHGELEIIEKSFVSNRLLLNMKDVKDLRISMINSGFTIDFNIDRNKLYNLMLKQDFDVIFDPEKHACVNIKYEHPEKIGSIFVFETGKIIITGVQTCFQLIDAYNFINKFLLMNYDKIVKNDNVTNKNIIKFLDAINIKEICNYNNLDDMSEKNDLDSEPELYLSDCTLSETIIKPINIIYHKYNIVPKKINKKMNYYSHNNKYK